MDDQDKIFDKICDLDKQFILGKPKEIKQDIYIKKRRILVNKLIIKGD